GLHAGGAVDEEDGALAGAGLPADLRLGQGEQGRDEDEELEEQEDVLAELLEGGVGLEVLDRLLPEEGGGDLDLAAAELEEVEDEQRGDRDGRGDAGEEGGGEGHGRPPASMPRCLDALMPSPITSAPPACAGTRARASRRACR